jgi:hypothetical protein
VRSKVLTAVREVRLVSSLSRFFALLAIISGGANCFAQVTSRGASVTLKASVQESFSAQHLVVPLTEEFSGAGKRVPRALLVSIGWNLRPGHPFQIASAVERRQGDEVSLARQGPMSLRQLEISSHVHSFMPDSEGHLTFLGASGRGKEDAAGVAVFMLLLPPPQESDDLTLRISIISL